jgi:chromosome segregation ATPase
LDKFRKEVAELNKQVSETSSKLGKMESQLNAIENAITIYPGADYKLLAEVRALKQSRSECTTKMWGDRIKTAREFEADPSLSERLNMLEYKLYENRSGVSNTHKRNKEIVTEEHDQLKQRVEGILSRIATVKNALQQAGVPYISE